jgi:hypothetical protein
VVERAQMRVGGVLDIGEALFEGHGSRTLAANDVDDDLVRWVDCLAMRRPHPVPTPRDGLITSRSKCGFSVSMKRHAARSAKEELHEAMVPVLMDCLERVAADN